MYEATNLKTQRGHSVDYENDRFKLDIVSCHIIVTDLPTKEQSDFVTYTIWMEHEYQYGNESGLVDKSPRDDWYSKRISWLRRLVSALGMSTTEAFEIVRNEWILYMEGEGIEHFLEAWETREQH
jgi:hypothetical protein